MADPLQTEADRRNAFLSAVRPRAPVVAQAYEAGRILIQGNIPARAMLLAHIVRELRNRLPDAFGAPTRDRLHYAQRLAGIRPLWTSIAERLVGPSSMETTLVIPVEAAQPVWRLLEDDAAVSEHIKARFLHMCAVATGEMIPWSGNKRLADEWAAIQVEGIAHSGTSQDADRDAIQAFETLESILLRLFEYAPKREARIRSLARVAAPDNVREHLRELYTLHDVDTYYGELANPQVFDALNEERAFLLSETTTYNYWPQGAYLQRIAPERPDKVAGVLRSLKIAAPPGITRQLFLIALALDQGWFVKVMKAARWARAGVDISFLGPLGQALSRLAALRQEAPLFGIARSLFRFKAEPGRPGLYSFDRPRATPIAGSTFESVLETVPVILATVDPVRALKFLMSSLDEVVVLEGFNQYEHFGFWFTDFMSDDTPRYDIKAQLTGAIYDAARAIALENLTVAVAVLDGSTKNTLLYRRMADAIVAHHGSDADAATRISDLADWTHGAETRALIERGFARLAPEQRLDLFRKMRETQRSSIASALTDQGRDLSDVDALVDAALIRILGSAIVLLPEPFASRLTAAQRVENAESTARAPDVEALEQISTAAVGTELERWLPVPADPLSVPWSIGGVVRIYIERNAATWLATPSLFETIPPYYLGWALNGLDTARRVPGPFDSRVVAVAISALRRAATAAGLGSDGGRDVAGNIAQNAGVLLVEEAGKVSTLDDVNRVLDGVRGLVQIVLPITYEVRSPWSAPSYDRSDPMSLAVHVIGALLRVSHNHGLDATAVRDAYDQLLHTNLLSVRAALGRFFSWFATKYPDNGADWAQRLFFSGNDGANRATWAGFVSFSAPSGTTHRLLRDAYVARIAEFATDTVEGEHRDPDAMRNIRARTYWHVWVLLANSIEKLDEPASLARQAVDSLSDFDVGEWLREIGESLNREGNDEPARRERVFASAIALWEWVEKQVEDGRRSGDVLRALPEWLGSPLPSDWRFYKIEALATLPRSRPRDPWKVVKALVDLATENRRRSLTSLARLLEPPRMETLMAIQQFAGSMLVDAIGGDPEEQHLARQIDSILVTNHRPSLLE